MIGAAAATIPASSTPGSSTTARARPVPPRPGPGMPGPGRLGLRGAWPGGQAPHGPARGCPARGQRARGCRPPRSGRAHRDQAAPGQGGRGQGAPGQGARRAPGCRPQAARRRWARRQPGCRRLAATQAADARGFLGALFDFSFTSFVTTRIIKVLYVLILVMVVLSRALLHVPRLQREPVVRLPGADHRGPAVHHHRDGVLAAGPGGVRGGVPDRRGRPGAARARRPLRSSRSPQSCFCMRNKFSKAGR